jgi:hypothetical protein
MNRRTENETEQQKAEQIQDNECKATDSAIPVGFRDYKDSVMGVTGILRVPTMCSRDILLQVKGHQLGRVHSDQMVLERIRPGRLVR